MIANENLGPAERILQTLLTYQDHLAHNRPGIVRPDASVPYGVAWEAATYKVENGQKIAYTIKKVGKKTVKTRVGVVAGDGLIVERGLRVGEYRDPGLFPEAVAWVYAQCAEVWRMDNEFAAKWASKVFGEEHKDIKVVLCALMLAQSRKGDHVGELVDLDYRDVGEAMVLLRRKDQRDISPKLLLRVGDVLRLPTVAKVNRDLGFAHSLKNPHMGRYDKVVQKWLRHREDNPLLLAQAVKSGWSSAIAALARRVGYKPTSDAFFRALRWKQTQAADGRRSMFIGGKLDAARSWLGKTEAEVCEAIAAEHPSWKQLTGLLPPEVGVTRAVMAAAIGAGALTDKDLVILTPTLEELGMLGDDKKTKAVKTRWEKACKSAEDLRAANIAKNVKSAAVKETLKASEDAALAKAAEAASRGMRIYVLVDISGSMQNAIEEAKVIVTKILAGIPKDRVHVAVFNSVGRSVYIQASTQAAVDLAFAGFRAGGGTSHASGVFALQDNKPADDEDSVLIVIGDGGEQFDFADAVTRSGLRPQAIGFVELPGENRGVVERTAAKLGVPVLAVDRRTFEGTYEVPRVLRNLIAATPVRQAPAPRQKRLALVDAILKTDLLQKPAWA